ncbi:serine hydrolase domain-containing protein [Paraglaciecola aestuariivivens]
MMKLLALSAALFCFSCSATTAKLNSQLHNLFAPTVTSPTVPGINVAIADQQGIVWAQAFGLADVENQLAMTTQHKMRVGSIAKLITVAAMMRFYQQHKVSLTTPVSEYVAAWPQHHAPISLLQLAAHTSGIRHYKNNAEFILNQTFADTQSSLALFKNDDLLFAPGTAQQYSTFAFSLIAAALEGADGARDFKQIIQHEVFTPLNMQDTAFDDQAPIIPLRPRPYAVKDGELVNAPQSDHSYKYAGGGFIASASDISRFAVAHSLPDYLPAKTTSWMFQPAQLNTGEKLPFGIGWLIGFDTYKDRSYYQNNAKAQLMMSSMPNAVMHAGGSNGGITMLILCRDHKRAVTVVKNVHGEHSADVFLLALEALHLFHQAH